MVATTLLTNVVSICNEKIKSDRDSSSCHAAIIFSSNNRILGSGCNSNDRTACGGCHLPSMHAEVSACMSAFGSSLTTTRLRRWVLRGKGGQRGKEVSCKDWGEVKAKAKV